MDYIFEFFNFLKCVWKWISGQKIRREAHGDQGFAVTEGWFSENDKNHVQRDQCHPFVGPIVSKRKRGYAKWNGPQCWLKRKHLMQFPSGVDETRSKGLYKQIISTNLLFLEIWIFIINIEEKN